MLKRQFTADKSKAASGATDVPSFRRRCCSFLQTGSVMLVLHDIVVRCNRQVKSRVEKYQRAPKAFFLVGCVLFFVSGDFPLCESSCDSDCPVLGFQHCLNADSVHPVRKIAIKQSKTKHWRRHCFFVSSSGHYNFFPNCDLILVFDMTSSCIADLVKNRSMKRGWSVD